MSALPRRFYTTCDVVHESQGYGVRLDGRIARSPGGRPLIAPRQSLARLVAEEWAGQDQQIDPATMPATRLLHTALDTIPDRRAQVASSVADFADADTLCYFAEGPASLVQRQQAQWRPLLAWSEEAHGLVFHEARGVIPVAQPPQTLAAVAAIAKACDDCELAGLAFAAALFSSAILALAVRDGRLGGIEALTISRLDAQFQEERWGVDAEAAAAHARLSADAAMLGRWFGHEA